MNSSISISDVEYAKLIKQLENFTTIKNNILTFSFTASIAILAAAITAKQLSPWICIALYFLIIPFAARVSYYRLASAHINSFLKIFAPDKMLFAIGSGTVLERDGLNSSKKFRIIAWLVNHEMFMLSMAITVVFWYLLIAQTEVYTKIFFVHLCIPIALSTLVFVITDSVYSYKDLSNNYNVRWLEYLANISTIEEQNNNN